MSTSFSTKLKLFGLLILIQYLAVPSITADSPSKQIILVTYPEWNGIGQKKEPTMINRRQCTSLKRSLKNRYLDPEKCIPILNAFFTKCVSSESATVGGIYKEFLNSTNERLSSNTQTRLNEEFHSVLHQLEKVNESFKIIKIPKIDYTACALLDEENYDLINSINILVSKIRKSWRDYQKRHDLVGCVNMPSNDKWKKLEIPQLTDLFLAIIEKLTPTDSSPVDLDNFAITKKPDAIFLHFYEIVENSKNSKNIQLQLLFFSNTLSPTILEKNITKCNKWRGLKISYQALLTPPLNEKLNTFLSLKK